MAKELTFDERGLVIMETQDGVNFPPDYSFNMVNNFVHSTDVEFEELQWLCLAMATELEKYTKPKM